jgi:hypothetical protein
MTCIATLSLAGAAAQCTLCTTNMSLGGRASCASSSDPPCIRGEPGDGTGARAAMPGADQVEIAHIPVADAFDSAATARADVAAVQMLGQAH